MKPSFLLVPILAVSAGLPVQALDFGDGFSATGDFELEYFANSDGDGGTLGYATSDIAYEQPGGGFGAFIGFDALTFETTNEIAVYGALTYSGGFGKVQVGVPRPVLDDYLDMPQIGGLRIIDLELATINHSVLTNGYLFGSADAPLGLRYDATFGDAKVGLSYHSTEGASIVDAAVNYQMGDILLRAGLEHFSAGGTSGTSFNLGANVTFGRIETGILLTSSSTISDIRAAQLFATFRPLDNLDVTATALAFNSGSGTNSLFGLAADYSFAKGAYVQAGVADGSGTDSLYNVSLGLKF